MNRNAQNAYAASRADLLDKLLSIQGRIEDLPAPDDDTNWGHVGDLASLHQALAPIIDTLDGWQLARSTSACRPSRLRRRAPARISSGMSSGSVSGISPRNGISSLSGGSVSSR